MFTRQKLMVGAIALGAMTCSAAALTSPYGVKVGVLNCTVDSGWGYVLGPSKDVHCAYHPYHGADDYYVGSISKFGVDIG